MKKVAVVTDSNSGITQQKAKNLGIYVLPMPFMIDGKDYFEDINLTQEEFYVKLKDGASIATSQPSIPSVKSLWDTILKEYDEIVHIPMSSGLSGTCETAMVLAGDYEGKVQVVDNQRISVTQRQSVLDAMFLVKEGKSASEIKEILEKEKLEASIYITVDTLTYLKKGGRVTPAAAAIGNVLNLKPVLQIQGAKLDAYSKARGMKQAKRIMIEAMKKDIEQRFSITKTKGFLTLQVAYTHNEAAAIEFIEELKDIFPGHEIYMAPLSLSVACHIGPGALALACSKKIG